MLPVIICEPNILARVRWTNVLERLIQREYPLLKIELLPGAKHELERTLAAQSGIILVILAVTSAAEGGIDACIQMFKSVMANNRDNYVMLCIYDSDNLDAVLSRCVRPAGILVEPFQDDLMYASLKHVLNDYVSLYDHGDDANYMLVNVGKTIQRVAYKDILYLEAQNKLLNICLRRRVIRVRESLNAVSQTLPEGFVRCHRSYIVNRAYIDQMDLSENTLRLIDGARLPLSRQYKNAMRREIEAGDGK